MNSNNSLCTAALLAVVLLFVTNHQTTPVNPPAPTPTPVPINAGDGTKRCLAYGHGLGVMFHTAAANLRSGKLAVDQPLLAFFKQAAAQEHETDFLGMTSPIADAVKKGDTPENVAAACDQIGNTYP